MTGTEYKLFGRHPHDPSPIKLYLLSLSKPSVDREVRLTSSLLRMPHVEWFVEEVVVISYHWYDITTSSSTNHSTCGNGDIVRFAYVRYHH